MGVNLSSALQSKEDPEGPAPLEDPPTPPATDPRLPLTARQLFSITKSWKGIARAMEPTGITMFVRLFEENEDILHLFQKFQHRRLHELHRDSMELAQHASIVMTTLDESIKKLGNVDHLVDYLHAIGKLHTRIPGFRRDYFWLGNVDHFVDYLHAIGKLHTRIPGFWRDYFWRIERPFLAAVQDTLGDRYTENMENIYKITIRYILDTIVKGFDLYSSGSDSAESEPPKASPDPPLSPQANSTDCNDIKEQVALKS